VARKGVQQAAAQRRTRLSTRPAQRPVAQTAPERTPVLDVGTGCRRTPEKAGYGAPSEAVVVAVTNGRLNGSTEGFDRAQPRASLRGLAEIFGTWERILCQLDG
jgi:hypothetical protein